MSYLLMTGSTHRPNRARGEWMCAECGAINERDSVCDCEEIERRIEQRRLAISTCPLLSPREKREKSAKLK